MGADIRTQRSVALAKVGCHRVGKSGALSEPHAVEEVLRISTVVLQTRKIRNRPSVLEIVDLRQAADRRVRGYSLGIAQALGFSARP